MSSPRTLHASPRDPVVRDILAAIGCRLRRDVRIRVAPTVQLDDLYWSGGTRSTYHAVSLTDYRVLPLPQADPPQFGGPRTPPILTIPDGIAILETGTFRGKPATPCINIAPANAARLLPGPVANLTDPQRIVLYYTAHLKPFARREHAARHGISGADWTDLVAALVSLKLLRKNGAITPAGRNAIADWRPSRKGA